MTLDHYLKFNDYESMASAMRENGIIIDDEIVPPYDSKGNFIDVVGNVVESKAEFDSKGNIIKQPILSDGFHVNTYPSVPDGLEPYEIETPNTPSRVRV